MEPNLRRLEVFFAGQRIADSRRGFRVLETSHPPVYYLPKEDLSLAAFARSHRRTFCEWKGIAIYYDIALGNRRSEDAAWSYPQPTESFEAIRDFVAIYPSKVDECRVNSELVEAQDGDFYGGWITRDIVGPFKGSPGTFGW